jgi:hypothetical protein
MLEEQLVAELVQLSGLADGIVMHPDTMDELALYRPLGHKLLLENMDSRKPDGRTPEDLHHVSLTDEAEELFIPVLRRCLDVPWIFEAPPQTDSL